MAPKVGAVGQRFVIDLKHNVIHGVSIFNIGAGGDIVCNIHNAGIVVADADFFFGAAHAVRIEACKRARRNGDVAEASTHFCKCGFHPDAYIRCAADDVRKLAVTCIDFQQVQFFRFGVGFDRFDFGDHNAGKVFAFLKNFIFHFGGGQRKAVD